MEVDRIQNITIARLLRFDEKLSSPFGADLRAGAKPRKSTHSLWPRQNPHNKQCYIARYYAVFGGVLIDNYGVSGAWRCGAYAVGER